jgi:Flp pilus assembly pilin Flp
MRKLAASAPALWTDRRGVSAVEYAVFAGVIAVALVVVFGTPESGVLSGLGPVISAAID